MPPRDLLLVTAAALLMVGAVVVQSAAMTVTEAGTMLELITDRTALLALAAFAALLIGRWAPARLMNSKAVSIGLIVIAIGLLAAVLAPGVGREVNGARRWIDIGPIGFQPSEVAKWALVLFIAWYATRPRRELRSLVSGLMPALLVVAMVCGLTLLEDLGTAVLIAAVATIMLLAGGARIWHMGMLAIPAGGVIVAAIATEGYRIQRLKAFLDPWADPAGSGYHVIQSMKAISRGDIGGLGLGNGVQKFGYLPEDTTDFIFAIVAEEFGALGCILVVALFLTLLWAGWRIVQMQRNPQRQLLALGITATISLQAMINLLVVTGLAPTKGIALPLVSSGGTGWILTALMIGYLASMDPTPKSSRTPATRPQVVPDAAA
jgi:cell division protein FtsW